MPDSGLSEHFGRPHGATKAGSVQIHPMAELHEQLICAGRRVGYAREHLTLAV